MDQKKVKKGAGLKTATPSKGRIVDEAPEVSVSAEAAISGIDGILKKKLHSRQVASKVQIAVCHACYYIGCPVDPYWHDATKRVHGGKQAQYLKRRGQGEGVESFPGLDDDVQSVEPLERTVPIDTPSGTEPHPQSGNF